MKLSSKRDTKIVVELIAKYYKYLEDVNKKIPEELFGNDIEFLSELFSMMIDDMREIIDEDNYNKEQEELEKCEEIEDWDKREEFSQKSKYIGSTDWIGDVLFNYGQGDISFDEMWKAYLEKLNETTK